VGSVIEDDDDDGAGLDVARGNGRREGVGTDSERYGEELEDEEAYLSYGRSETTSVRDLSVSADDDGDDDGYRTP